MSKYVVSSTLQDPKWERTTVLRGALVDEIQTLKSKPGRDIVTTGSMTVVCDLIAAGLVDEYRAVHVPGRARPRPAFVRGRDRRTER
ncbi:MAG: dihydrofolate reductase family protein [Gaiellaceae bacterium]